MLVAIAAFSGSCFYGKTIVVSRGIAHFSFERPEGYSLDKIEVRNDSEHRYTDVGLSSPLNDKGYYTATIGIFVNPISDVFPDAAVALEYSLSTHSGFKDFELLQRFTTTVAGTQGQGFVASYSSFRHPTHPVPGWNPYVTRQVFFGSNGLIFQVSILSDASTAEVEKADFEHILETFKILD
jgi:hypothetical protein